MNRRTLLAAAFTAPWALSSARAQTASEVAQPPPRPISPQNDLERAFVAALHNERLRPAFRRQLLESNVALALSDAAAESPPLEMEIGEGAATCFIFTSARRLDSVLGPTAPRIVLLGRAALMRVRDKHVAVNARLSPMLTLAPEDVAIFLSAEAASSAGPTQ